MEATQVSLSSEMAKSFISLIKSNNLEELSSVLNEAKEAAYPNVLVVSFEVLRAALWQRSLSVVQLVVRAGVSQESLDKALLEAASDSKCEENLDITEYLLKAGANPHALNPYGHSALSYAIFCALGDDDVINTVKLLLPYCNHKDLNAVIDTQNRRKFYTVMMLAASKCHSPEMISALMDAGASVFLANESQFICSHSNAIQTLVSEHPGSVENLKAILAHLNPFAPVGNISIFDSILGAYDRFRSGSQCTRCQCNGSDQNLTNLLNALHIARVNYAREHFYKPLVEESLEFLAAELRDLVVSFIDDYSNVNQDDVDDLRRCSTFEALKESVPVYVPEELLKVILDMAGFPESRRQQMKTAFLESAPVRLSEEILEMIMKLATDA